MPDRVDRSPAVSPASVSSLKPAKTEDPSQLSPSTSCGRRFSAAKSPPEPAPVTDVQVRKHILVVVFLLLFCSYR